MSQLRSIRVIAAFTLLEGVKHRVLWLACVMVLIGFLLTEFAGALAITETKQIQSAFMAFFHRLLAVLIMSLFVISSQAKEYQNRCLEMILALPVPRSGYLLGRLIGFSILAVIIVALFTLPLNIYANTEQVLFWGVSLYCELLILIALSLVFLATFNHMPPAITGVFLVYWLSRVIASLQLVGTGPIMDNSLSTQVFAIFLDGLAFFLPALDRFTQSEWVVYGTGNLDALVFVLAQTAIYVALLISMAFFDFYRKNI